MADYWRGGWANQTEMLPGTRAAAMDKGRYGPWNALADIIGAVWKRNAQRGAMKEAEQFVSDFDTNNPSYEAPSRDMQLGKTADQTDQQALQEQQRLVSYDDYAQKADDSVAGIMRDLTMKYGVENAKLVADSLQNQVNERKAAFGRKALEEKMGELQGLYGGIGTPTGNRNFYGKVLEYNRLAQQLGAPVITPQEMKSIADTAATKQSVINAGGQQYIMEAPAYVGRFDDGSSIRTVGTIQNTLSPVQRSDAEFKREGLKLDKNKFEETKRHNLAMEEEAKRNHDLTASTKKKEGLTTQQVSALKAVIEQYQKFEENNLDGAENPYREQAEEALRILSQAGGLGGSSVQSGGNSGGQSGGNSIGLKITGDWNQDVNIIKELNRRASARGKSPEEIAAGITEFFLKNGAEQSYAEAAGRSVL